MGEGEGAKARLAWDDMPRLTLAAWQVFSCRADPNKMRPQTVFAAASRGLRPCSALFYLFLFLFLGFDVGLLSSLLGLYE